MSSALPAILVSFAAPGLVLLVVFHTLGRRYRRQPQGWGWFLGSAAVALGVLALPFQGLPLARWLAGVVDHWSIPGLALLATMVSQKFFGVELLRRADRQAAWVFGAVAGVTLYPLALGLGPFDTYSLGWHFSPLFAIVGMVAVILQWWRNRFGVVLFLSAGAWALGLPESANYWDCLMDPFYFFASLGMLGSKLSRGRSPQIEPSSQAAS